MTAAHCQLTAKDFDYLKSLATSKDFGEPFQDLLRRKMSTASVRLDHTIDARVATIDSRLTFSVGGGFTEERVLTRNEKGATQNLALPITTLRGLALLGLKEGDVFSLRKPDGIIEPIRLLKVSYQPEAARRNDPASAVIQFQPRWKTSVGCADEASDPFNDDPGPGAA